MLSFRRSRLAIRSDVQGLRGVAVLLVVLYHAGLPILPGGFIGVDVFFVISGFLITGLLVREVIGTGRISYTNFIGRRIRRLLPAALFLIVVVVVGSLFVYPPLERADIVSAARASTLYVANLWFAGRAIDYLGGTAASNPMLHMWSLAVEEQFYLLWPAMLAFASARARPGRAGRRILTMVAAVSMVSFLTCVWMSWVAQPWAFFGTPFRAWEFGLGAMVYLASDRLSTMPPAWSHAMALAGAAAIGVGAVLLDEQVLFPGAWAVLPAGGAALVLAALQVCRAGLASRLLSIGPLARAGDVSYSWYLWHWPLLVVVPVVLPHAGVYATVGAVIVSYVAAELSYRYVEEPFRHGEITRIRPSVVLGTTFVITFAGAAALTVMKTSAAEAELSHLQRLFADARKDIPAVSAAGCHVRIKATEVKECVAGPSDAGRLVVLMGDSHAAHWYPALEEAAVRNGWRLVSMTKSGCPWVDTPIRVGQLRREYHECATWRAAAMERVAELNPALVVLANGHHRIYVPAEQWEAGARKTIAALTGMGVTTAVMRDTVWPGFDVPACLARAEHRNASLDEACSYDLQSRQQPATPIFEAERRAASTSKTAMVVDMTGYICASARCPVFTGEFVQFSDHSHLSARFSRSLAPALAAELAPAWQLGSR